MENSSPESNERVRDSRTGDDFHYCWAARRCLKMIVPNSDLKSIFIEGSGKRHQPGEYSIDVAEYYTGEAPKEIYYQLKHSVRRVEEPFQLSEFEKTLSDFAARFRSHAEDGTGSTTWFVIVTNRPFASGFLTNLEKLRNHLSPDKRFLSTIQKYTGLSDVELFDFCTHLSITDTEENYLMQRKQLSRTLGLLCFCSEHANLVDVLIEYIKKKALPGQDSPIYAEDVLGLFGFASIEDFLPAPSKLSLPERFINRDCYPMLVDKLMCSRKPVIIHAAGGVGKSVFSSALQQNPPDNSLVIVYDCFAMGEYRNRSQHRHRHKEFITQIINELALMNLCDYILPDHLSKETPLFRVFLNKIEAAVSKLRAEQPNANVEIFILVDAADNSELAALDSNENCFAHELIRETMPEHCHLVMTCRTERLLLVDRKSEALHIPLPSFSEDESREHLAKTFCDVSIMQGKEFHRLTSGNPRVQEQIITSHHESLSSLLISLGPDGASVEGQLEMIYRNFANEHPADIVQQIEMCCHGFVSLPPNVPISVLERATSVPRALISSLVAQFGGSIWCDESYLRFRDETTETWFRERFPTNSQTADIFVEKLRPYASSSVYISEAIPGLLILCEKYDELIGLALSNSDLPEFDSSSSRKVRLYRATCAFRAALRLKHYGDATKLAAICGEELSGNKRQSELFRSNVALTKLFNDDDLIKELAFQRAIRGEWLGSESVYTAAVLSNSVLDHGTALAFLRSGDRWLHQYFIKRDSEAPSHLLTERLTDDDIFAFVFTYYNLFGTERTIEYIASWNDEAQFSLFRRFAEHLIDFGFYDAVDTIINSGNGYALFAANLELSKIGRFIPKIHMLACFKDPAKKDFKFSYREYSVGDENHHFAAIIALVEAAIHYKIEPDLLKPFIEKMFLRKADISFRYEFTDFNRRQFLQSAAIQSFLGFQEYYDNQSWLPERYFDKKGGENEDVKECNSIMKCLLPWYIARITLIANGKTDLYILVQKAEEETHKPRQARYGQRNAVPAEISHVFANTIAFVDETAVASITTCIDKYPFLVDDMRIPSKLLLTRAAARCDGLEAIFLKFEKQIKTYLESTSDDTNIVVERWAALIHATIAYSKDDARVYLNRVLTYISRFGDELPQRWQSIAALATKASEENQPSDELAYRFIRCAECAGNNVSREKYWDRSEAMQLCTRLSPGQGLAATSRWRDRDVGTFENHFLKVLLACIEKGFFDTATAWVLAPFIHDSDLFVLGCECIRRSKSPIIQNSILSRMLEYSEKLKIRIYNWAEIKAQVKFATDESVRLVEAGDTIDQRFEMFAAEQGTTGQSPETQMVYCFESKRVFLEEQIKAIGNQYTVDSMNKILGAYRSGEGYRALSKEFWCCFFEHVPIGQIASFLSVIPQIEEIDFYELINLAKAVPQTWRTRPSFTDAWRRMLSNYARLHPRSIIQWFPERRIWHSEELQDQEKKLLTKGAIEQAEKASLESDQDYFDFICVAATVLSAVEANSALLFSIERMELQIEELFGDGEWDKLPSRPTSNIDNAACFIWASLGSVDVEIRWDAIHALMHASDLCNIELLDSVLRIAQFESTANYIPINLPFYVYSAQQFLLIALARIALEKPQLISKHKDYLISFIGHSHAHALLQRLALRVIEILDVQMSDFIEKEKLETLKCYCKSPFPILPADHSTRQTEELIETTGDQNFYFDIDFRKYGLEELERLFSMSEETISNLVAAEIRLIDPKNSGSYSEEPRDDYFSAYRRRDYSRLSSLSPKLENYSFYLSFHAMLFASSFLLKEHPIYQRWSIDETEDPWENWMVGLEAAQRNGYLASDFRTKIPEDVLFWVTSAEDNDWENNMDSNEFLNAIRINENEICVNGLWRYRLERNSIYQEEIYVRSVLVEKETCESLIEALLSYENPDDYRLPMYDEDTHEFISGMFQLHGWILHEYSEHEIGEHDFWSGTISYPSNGVGAKYMQLLGLEKDCIGSTWTYNNGKEIALQNQSWAEPDCLSRESEVITGERLIASADF